MFQTVTKKLIIEIFFLRQALIRIALTLLFFSTCRLLFYIFNSTILPSATALDFLYGLKFDLSAAMYVNTLVWLTYILPLSIRLKIGYLFFQKITFIVSNFIALSFELGDIGYFRFANRRMVLSDFALFKNTLSMIPTLLIQNWYLALLGLVSLFIFNTLYKKTTLSSPPLKTYWLTQILLFIFGIVIFIVAARGGLQHRPLTPLSSAEFASDLRLMPLVSNTTLNVIHSSGQRFLAEKTYMSDTAAEHIYPVFIKPHPNSSFRPVNVVVIAIESCGKEYSAFFNSNKMGYQGFTPVLDSIAQQSLYCENTFANGLRSTQGVAAISTGLPSLMEDPFMFSPYQSNLLDGLGAHLRRKGYNTAFFHGAHRGSMDFDKFAPLTGFSHFYAREDFPEKEGDYDGTWGIWDEPMFQFMLNKLNVTPQPFYGMIFTLTSHHPYAVPTWFEKKYPTLEPVERATLYTDWTLGQFFAEAKKQPWFENTLFVISADHTGAHSTVAEYQTVVGRFKIPILFYKPNEIKPTVLPRVGQQIDIAPSVLDFLHYDAPYLSFGRSIFTPLSINNDFYAVNFEEGLYQIHTNQYALLFDGSYTKGLFDYTKDTFLKNDLSKQLPEESMRLEHVIKAIIQQHNKGMLHNGLTPKS